MNKRYYELNINGDEYERYEKGLYSSIAHTDDRNMEKQEWLVTKGRPLRKEEWPLDFSFKLTQDIIRDQNLNNTLNWLLFSDELCDVIVREKITGVQFLPIKIYDMKGRIIPNYRTVANVDNKAFCMDMEKSIYKTYREYFGKESVYPSVPSDRIISIKKLVLRKDKLPETNIFRLGDMCTIITDERFVDVFTERHYTGFRFDEIEVA